MLSGVCDLCGTGAVRANGWAAGFSIEKGSGFAPVSSLWCNRRESARLGVLTAAVKLSPCGVIWSVGSEHT